MFASAAILSGIRRFLAVVAAAALGLAVGASAAAARPVRNGHIFLAMWQENDQSGDAYSVWEVRPGSASRRLRGARMWGGVPCVSPDGRWLAYVGWPRVELVARRIYHDDRVGPRHLVARLPLERGHGYGDCAWSPHGSSLVVAADDEAHLRRDGVWTVHRDGTRLRRIFSAKSIPGDPIPAEPVWSTTGRIAVADDEPEIAVVDADGKNLTVLQGFHGQRPAWSREGRTLAFVRGPDWFYAGPLWAAAPDGTQLRPVRSGFVEAAAFSPDGRRLAIARLAEERHGNHHEEVMVARPDGSRARTLLRMPNTLPWYAIGLTWARGPDGD
jgi:hypothetical protein